MCPLVGTEVLVKLIRKHCLFCCALGVAFTLYPKALLYKKTPFIAALKLSKLLGIQTNPVLEVEFIDEAKRHRGAVRC